MIRSGENRPAGGRWNGDEQIVAIVGGFGARPDDCLGGEACVELRARAQRAVQHQETARIEQIDTQTGLRYRRINSR
jgi:hypothetical protein